MFTVSPLLVTRNNSGNGLLKFSFAFTATANKLDGCLESIVAIVNSCIESVLFTTNDDH